MSVKITIEETTERGTSSHSYYFDDMELEQDRGIDLDRTGVYNHNSQHRMKIEAWSGCKTYKSFKPLNIKS